MENNIVRSERNINDITSEIKELQMQARNIAVSYAVEIGRRLTEAKSILPYGQWGEWLKNEVEFSQSSANNFMKLFEEYGDRQISVFGAVVNSQTIAKLPYTKALALLSVPAEEREEFAERVDAEHLSVKELQNAIAERDEAIRKAEKARIHNEELKQACASAEIARATAENREKAANEKAMRLSELEKQLEASAKRESELKEKLKKAMSNPKIPPEELKKIKEEAAESVGKSIRKELSAEIEKARAEAISAEKERSAAAGKLEAAERELAAVKNKLKTANTDVTEFKTNFERLQDDIFITMKSLKKVEDNDPETAKKLRAALAALIKKMGDSD